MLELSKAIAVATLFTSKDKTNPALQHVAFVPIDGCLIVTAANGGEGFFGVVELPANFGKDTYLLHRDVAATIKANTLVSFDISVEDIKLHSKGCCISLKKDGVDFHFPNVVGVIPTKLDSTKGNDDYHYSIAPASNTLIIKTEKIINNKIIKLPDWQPNGHNPWLYYLSDNAFCIAMPYRTKRKQPSSALHQTLTKGE